MKKIITLTLFVAAISLLSSCKKKDEDPVPVTTTPAINQSSTTAPSLIPGTSTTLSIYAGANYEDYLDLDDGVLLDPQGDNWSITSVTSSNTNVATVAIDDDQVISYVGITAGTATLSVTVADVDGNSNVITLTLTVTADLTPRLNPGETTSFYLTPRSELTWNLTSKVTDPQGDVWTITSITSTNTGIVTASVGSTPQSASITGVAVGIAGVTIVVTDANNNSSTINATIYVETPAAPIGAKQNP